MDTTESSTLYHIPQQSISYKKLAGIEYRQTHVIGYQKQLHVPQPITHTEKPGQIESSTIYHIPQQSISHAQPLTVTNSQPSALQYEQSQVIPQQAVRHEPVRTEFFCMLCMEYIKTYRKLEKHMERFHDELRQENRGIKRGGLKDIDEHIRKRNKVMDNEVEMSGDGFKNQDTESDGDIDPNNDSEDNDGDEDNDGYDSQPDDSDYQSKGGDDQFDESGDNDDDGNDDDRDVIKYMRGFGDI